MRFLVVAVMLTSCGSLEELREISDDPRVKAVTGGKDSPMWAAPQPLYVSHDATQQTAEATHNATRAWNDAIGRVVVYYAGRQDGVAVTELFAPLRDNVSVVYWLTDWEKQTGKSVTTLGTTVWSESMGLMSKADVLLNADYYDIVDAEVEYGVDAESLLLHEIGHMLGLDHSDMKGDVMLPTMGIGVTARELSDNDRKRITNLYEEL